jgi:hypothetical protein
MEISEIDRINILIMRGYGDLKRSYQAVADLFNERFPNRPPISKNGVVTTIHRFEEHGTVKDLPRSGRPKTATNEDVATDVLVTVMEEPHSTLRNLGTEYNISSYSVWKILNSNKYHPYKIHLVQELSEDDFDRRIEYCDTMMQRLDTDPNFVKNIVFSDEASFLLNGNVNRHNCRYWSDTNPHWKREAHTQHPQKVNVWSGLIGSNVIGPFFINGNLNGDTYRNLLIDRIIPAIQDLGLEFNSIWFQQDGAPPHYAVNVRNLLDETFPEQWIGRRGRIEWPARSPDLSPLDYFFWGYLKDKVYQTKPNDINDLKQRILHEAAEIPPEMLRNVMDGYYNRLAHCQTAMGEQFEHLL